MDNTVPYKTETEWMVLSKQKGKILPTDAISHLPLMSDHVGAQAIFGCEGRGALVFWFEFILSRFKEVSHHCLITTWRLKGRSEEWTCLTCQLRLPGLKETRRKDNSKKKGF